MNLREAIDTRPMVGYQWVVVWLCTLLNALDGYDVLAMAFTANAVTQEFGLTGSQLGVLLSAGLLGMAVGSLVLGPLADRFGRRPVLIAALVINAVGLFLSVTAGSVWLLGLWRVVTGLGVGGILASATVLTSEYANRSRRGMAVSIFTAGYGLGATLGGLGAAELIPSFGWRSVFLVGGLLTLVATAAVVALLPESVDYLSTGRGASADRKARVVGRRLKLEDSAGVASAADSRSPGAERDMARAVVEEPADGGKPRDTVFSQRYLVQSLLLWVSFFVIMFGFYFANTWTPRLLVESGMSEQQGIVGGLLLTLGGTFGSLLYGLLTTRISEKGVLIAFVVLSSVFLVVFITTTSMALVAFASGVVVGMLVNGCIAGMYTLAPMTYEPHLRTTGVGWGIGIGRAGAILAPITVGALLDAGWTPVQLYIGVAAIMLLSALALLRLRAGNSTRKTVAA